MSAGLFRLLRQHRLLPALALQDAAGVAALGRALVDEGLPFVEVMLRTEASWKALEELVTVPGLCVGIGSVRDTGQLRDAKVIGAQFAVSAGYNPALVETAQEAGMEYLPGVATPSEILAAVMSGITVVKWFPATALGGASALHAISAPFPDVRFVPTGGISGSNAGSYLGLPEVLAVGGTWMFPSDLVSRGDVDGLRQVIRAAMTTATAKSEAE